MNCSDLCPWLVVVLSEQKSTDIGVESESRDGGATNFQPLKLVASSRWADVSNDRDSVNQACLVLASGADPSSPKNLDSIRLNDSIHHSSFVLFFLMHPILELNLVRLTI